MIDDSGMLIVSAQRSSSPRSSKNAFCSTWASRMTSMSAGAGRNGAPLVTWRYLRRNAPDTQRYQASAHGRRDGAVLDAHDRGLQQRGERRVVERADHPGHVAQRVVLAAALRQRLRRWPIEIDDDEVLAGVEQLLQVVVAVRADLQAGEALAQVRLEHLQHLFLAADEAPRVLDDAVGDPDQAVAQQAQRLAHQVAHRLIVRSPVQRRIRGRREARRPPRSTPAPGASRRCAVRAAPPGPGRRR